MDERLRQVYDMLISDGLMSAENVSFDDFSNINEQQINSFYEGFKQDGLISDQITLDDFSSMWSKKKDSSQESGMVQEDMVSDLEVGSSDFTESQTTEENTLVERVFGKNMVTDLMGDMVRAYRQGQAQGASVDEGLELFLKGNEATEEDVADFIEAQKVMRNAGESDEMKSFNKIYQNNGGGWLGFTKGVLKNPTVVPQLFVSSVSAMLNPTVLSGAATGGATGAAVGSLATPIGTLVGGMGGAMGGATLTLEAGLSFAEFLQEEIGEGVELTDDNIRKVLEDEEALGRIRRKAAGRGIAIGTIDAITGGIASKVTKGVATKALREGKKLSKTRGAVAGIGTEAVGGSLGEVGGRLVAGQEMDVAEIGFEGIAGTATAPLSVGVGLYKSPKYTLNGERVDGKTMIDLIEKGTPEEIAGATINIKNDDTLLSLAQEKKDDAMQSALIRGELKEAGVEESKIEELTKLELQKRKLSNNKTEAGKAKLKEINKEIAKVTLAAEPTTPDTKTEQQEVKIDAEIKTDKPLTEEQKEISEFFGLEVDENSNLSVEDKSIVINKRSQLDPAAEQKKPSVAFDSLLSMAKTGLAATKSIIPDIKVVLHETTEQYRKTIKSDGVAEYNPATKTIHIDASGANMRTVPHELFHAVLIEKLADDSVIAPVTKKMVQAVNKVIAPDSVLKKELDDFVNLYDNENIRNEEQLAELTGILAENLDKLSKPEKNAVLQLIKDIGVKLGFEMNFINQLTTDEEATIDLLNTLSRKFTTGEQVTVEDLSYLDAEIHGSLIDNASGVVPSNIDTEGGNKINLKRQQKTLLNRRNINMNDIKTGSINDLEGTNAFVFAADKAVYGEIQSPSGLKFNFSGGFLYPYGSGKGWAFTDKLNAQKVLNKAKESDGVGFVMVQGPGGITGSFNFWQYLNAEIAHSINQGVPPKDLLNYVNKKLQTPTVAASLKKKGAPLQIENLEQLNTLMPFEGKNKFSYAERANFADKFFTGESAEKFGIPPLVPNKSFNTGVLDYVNDPALVDTQYGDIVSAIQFDKNSDISELREGDPNFHPSYPFVIEGKPIMVFDTAVDVRKVYADAKPKSKTMNQTPLGKRERAAAAKSAMGGQYITRVKKTQPTGAKINVKPRQQRRMKKYRSSMERLMEQRTLESDEFKKFVQEKLGVDEDTDKKTPKPRQQKKPKDKKFLSLDEYIDKARDAGFTDARIKDFLVNVTKRFSAREVNKALASSVPASFGNMTGGVNAAKKLIKKIKTFQTKLTKKNARQTNPQPDSVITDEVIKYMESQPEFKNQNSQQQAEMLADVQVLLEGKPTVKMANRLRNIKMIAASMSKGERNLQQVKRDLKNYMRRHLPRGLYTRTEALRLVNKITKATQKNIDNVIDEVAELVVEKNVQILNNDIDTILSEKFTKTEGGIVKGVKVSNEVRKRINAIKKAIGFGKKLDADTLVSTKQKLLNDIDALSKEPTLSDTDVAKLVDLQIAINLIEAQLLENNNPSKAEILADASKNLNDIIEFGRTELAAEVKAAHELYKKDLAKAYKSITGKTVDPSSPDFRDKISSIQQILDNKAELKKRQGNALTRAMRRVGKKIQSFINRSEALDGLMDLISTVPGEMFGGELQTLVTQRIDDASIEYKGRRMKMEAMIKNKMKQIYGKDWAKKSRKHREKIYTDIYTSKVDQFKRAVEKDPSPENKQLYQEAVESQVQLLLSPNEMYYLVNQFKDPKNHPSFKAKFGPEFKRVINEMEALLKKDYPDLLEFSNWQVNEMYPMLYDHYNKVYKKIYRTDLPWNQNYAGRLYKEGTDIQPLDLLGENGEFIGGGSVTGKSTHTRTDNASPIQIIDGTDAMMTYLNDMEYFAAYAEPIKLVNKIFTNTDIKNAIKAIHGDDINKLINTIITRIANRGTNNPMQAKIINAMNNVFIVSRLALSPVIALKQLTSMFTYANDIGVGNWAKYSMKNLGEIKKTWKEITDNSVYMQDRKYSSILQTIESYTEEGMLSFVPGSHKQFYLDFLMFTTKFGDRSAIMLGGMPNYMYYKDQYRKANPNASEQEVIDNAIKKFERDTKRTQQSGDIQDKDYFQTADPIIRAMNMFLTTPKQYLRKEIQAVRNLYRKVKAQDPKAGKGTVMENIRTFFMYHFAMPVLFQYVAIGLPGILRPKKDGDEEDLLRAAALGNLNAFFLFGEVFSGVADAIQGKPWDFQPKSLGALETSSRIMKKWKQYDKAKTQLDKLREEKEFKKAVKQNEKVQKLLMEALAETTTLGPSPAPVLLKYWYNIGALDDPNIEPGEAIARVLNYSQYQLAEPEKPKKKKKIPLRDLKILDPEAYNEIQREKELMKRTPEYQEEQKRKAFERREYERQLRESR
tara:strand:+ start:7066 stop:14139 length:7074 start_codon:yes stop_codon:yes gene_type:complete